jgi:hypothetical protein
MADRPKWDRAAQLFAKLFGPFIVRLYIAIGRIIPRAISEGQRQLCASSARLYVEAVKLKSAERQSEILISFTKEYFALSKGGLVTTLYLPYDALITLFGFIRIELSPTRPPQGDLSPMQADSPPLPSHAAVFRSIAPILPRRLLIEDLGDALEEIAELEQTGAPRWQIRLKVVRVHSWLLLNALREVASVIKGLTSTK